MASEREPLPPVSSSTTSIATTLRFHFSPASAITSDSTLSAATMLTAGPLSSHAPRPYTVPPLTRGGK